MFIFVNKSIWGTLGKRINGKIKANLRNKRVGGEYKKDDKKSSNLNKIVTLESLRAIAKNGTRVWIYGTR